jgi:3-deoxy-7-phosphoheptulonate synthase
LDGKDERLVVIVGPCSIHDSHSAVEYAKRLKALAEDVSDRFFLIMRFFVEKPRTRIGWKGILYDPHLDHSDDIAEGVPCATEFLEPLVVPYFEDLITWGLIGARTSASQPHRQLASGIPFPVGLKNGYKGELDIALAGIEAAESGHSLIKINQEGKIIASRTRGNPHAHLVLRGSDKYPNYDPESVTYALKMLSGHNLKERLLIDCSHGNSRKDHKKQQLVFESVMEQVQEGNRAIRGVMIESHIESGKQSLKPKEALQYGLSITDSCLGWNETADLLRFVTPLNVSDRHQ